MAKLKERNEKICLNCGAELQDLYCHACGQKNIEPRRPLWEIPWAFIEDIINVDGKFFKTLKRLLFSPGYLAKAYIGGKRNSYNDPVRIYIVTSFIYFIVMAFVFNQLKKEIDQKVSKENVKITTPDSTDNNNGIHFNDEKNSNFSNNIHTSGDTTSMNGGPHQAATILKSWVDETSSNLPYLLWFSVPLFALVLKLLYIRRKIFYWDHLIFSLNIYSNQFLLISFSFLLFYLLRWIFKFHDETLLIQLIVCFASITGIVYVFLAMKNFYSQGFFKTFLKCTLFYIIGLFLAIFEIAGFIAILSLIAEV